MTTTPVQDHRVLPGGDTDDLCCFCHEWCTENAHCGNRYWTFHGSWLGSGPPPGRPRLHEHVESGVAIVPLCDRCAEAYGFSDGVGESIEALILGRPFEIDAMYREND